MPFSRAVPILLICGLVIAAIGTAAVGKDKQTFEGLVLQDGTIYTFYPKAKGCEQNGTPYLVVATREFLESLPSQPIHLQGLDQIDLLHGAWSLKLNGNLSHVGFYHSPGKYYWRELSVNYVVDAKVQFCK